MWQIASLLLLQRLKGNISGDVHDFNNMGRELSSSFFSLQVKAPKEVCAFLREVLREHASSYATVKNWVA